MITSERISRYCRGLGALALFASMVFSPGRAPAAVALPVFVDAPNVLGYIKFAPPQTVFAKIEAYGQQLAPDQTQPGVIAQMLGAQFPNLDKMDLARGATVFILAGDMQPQFVGYIPLNPGGAEAFANFPTAKVIGDHVLISGNPATLAEVAAINEQLRDVVDAPAQADVRVFVNVEAADAVFVQLEQMTGLVAMGNPAQAKQFTDAFEKIKQLGCFSLDLQMAREGAEFQLTVFPKVDTEVAAFCAQETATEFPMARFLTGDGGVRVVASLAWPEFEGALEPALAYEFFLPGGGMMSMAFIAKMIDPDKAAAAIAEQINKQLEPMGVAAESVMKKDVRRSDDVAIDQVDFMEAAMNDPNMAMAASSMGGAEQLKAMYPPMEIAYCGGYLLTAMGAESMDMLIQLVKAGGKEAKPLASQAIYPGGANFYADIDLAKMIGNMVTMAAMMAPQAGAEIEQVLSVLSQADVPPLAAMGSFTGGVGQMKLYIPLATAKAFADMAEEMEDAISSSPAGMQADAIRAGADLRSLATGIESYFIDNNAYPESPDMQTLAGPGAAQALSEKLSVLTTPIAYLLPDMLIDKNNPSSPFMYFRPSQEATPVLAERGFTWFAWSVGPDGVSNIKSPADLIPPGVVNNLYDPTNGSVSQGDIIRSNKGVMEGELNQAPAAAVQSNPFAPPQMPAARGGAVGVR